MPRAIQAFSYVGPSTASLAGSAGKPRAQSPAGKRQIVAPVDGRSAERATHVVGTPPSSHRQRAGSPAKKSVAGKATPSNETAVATGGKRPGKVSSARDASPSGGKKKGATALVGAAGMSSIHEPHHPQHHPLSNASSADEVVFHADLDGSSHVADPRDFDNAAGAASTAAATTGLQHLSFDDIPHARFAVPGIGHVAGAARPTQAGALIFGDGAADAGGAVVGRGTPHESQGGYAAFGASTDAADAKLARDLQATRGRVDERLYSEDNGAAGARTAAAAAAAARSGLGAPRADLAGAAGGQSAIEATHPKGYQHGVGVAYVGAGREAVATQPGHAGQARWQVGTDETGLKPAESISTYDGGDAESEWAGMGGGPQRTSGGRPGQRKWHVGGDFVGVRPVADISDFVFESEQKFPSAG